MADEIKLKLRSKGTSKVYNPLIFLHIPKTGGMTLSAVVQGNYALQSTYEIRGKSCHADKEKLAKLPAEELQKLHLIKGHAPYGLHEYLGERTLYITMLRDPVDRIISLYHYIVASTDNPLHKKLTDAKVSLEEFVAGKLTPQTDNHQVRMLSGLKHVKNGECSEEMLATAKRNIERHFAVVGLTERFDESLMLMARTLGWAMPYYVRTNVTSKRPRKAEIPEKTLEAIRSRNRVDILLYDYAADRLAQQLNRQSMVFRFQLMLLKIRNRYRK